MSVLKIKDGQGNWISIPTVKGNKGDKGDPGIDGHSPVVTATKSNGVTSVSVDGVVIATINDGEDATLNVTADEYSASTTYSVGDYCAHEGNLYRCIVPIETAEAWTPGHWTQVTLGEEISSKAEADGTYENLTVGQILSDNYTEDSTPYLLRPTGVAATQEYDEIVGGTVCWNQLCRPLVNDYWTASSNATVSISDDVATITASAENAGLYVRTNYPISVLLDHVYLPVVRVKATSQMTVRIGLSGVAAISDTTIDNLGEWVTVKKIYKATMSFATSRFYVTDKRTENWDSWQAKEIICVDLTQMFGSTIADYIYTLEQTTAGSGIAKLQEWGFFTKDYYPYNAGTLMSVKTSGHKTTVNNQEHLYPLSDIELRGIPKLDSGNNLYYDGDTYESDGTVTRKYGVVDMGTLTWERNTNLDLFFTNIGDAKYVGSMKGNPCKCSALASVFDAVWSGWNAFPDHSISVGNNYATGRYNTTVKATEYTDAATFKAAMSGVMLIYELAESTTETTDPFASPQFCDEYGTEEYIDTRDVPIPVGHNTRYPENLKKKLEGLPWSAVSDVQVNGTSVVTDGVANVPVAVNQGAAGVVAINNNNGIKMNDNNQLTINKATDSQTKSGTGTYSPIVPANQHLSTFYGLAKAAGDITQSASSNAVGAYTDDAKIKIQKMLGIYEPEWELIEDFTLEQEGGFDKSAETNGTPYNFRSVYIRITVPANSTTASVGYGRWIFTDGSNKNLIAETGKYAGNTAQVAKCVLIERRGSLAIANHTTYTASGGRGAWAYKLLTGISFDFGNIQRIYLNSSDVEPAGAHVEIYAQRAY